MTIAVHISPDKINGLLHTSANILAEKYSDHHFIFFAETALMLRSENCTLVIISPKHRNKLLRHYWYNYKLPAALKRYNADAFISSAGMISLKTDIDQYLVFENDNFKSEKRNNNYYGRIFRNALLKAKMIFVAEDFFKAAASAQLPEGERKIRVVYHGFGEKYKQLDYQRRQLIKDEHTGGYDYFLYPVTNISAAHLITVLKALSLFKKRQRSSLKLVLLLQQNIADDDLIKDFKNYKHREDVIFVKDESSVTPGIVGAAYAMIDFCEYAEINFALQSMYAGVSLIVENNVLNNAVFNDAVFFAEANPASLAEKMMLLYKDEDERNRLIDKGRAFTFKYDEHAAANAIWDTVTGK